MTNNYGEKVDRWRAARLAGRSLEMVKAESHVQPGSAGASLSQAGVVDGNPRNGSRVETTGYARQGGPF